MPRASKKIYNTCKHSRTVEKFCAIYDINSFQYPDELFSFAVGFQNFDTTLVTHSNRCSLMDDELTTNKANFDVKPTFIDCLSILRLVNYNLVDVSPNLVKYMQLQ